MWTACPRRTISVEDVGQTIKIQPTQEQLGYSNGDSIFTLNQLNDLRSMKQNKTNLGFEIDWNVTKDNVGMGVATRSQELAASMFQSVNAVGILIFGLVFTSLWTFLGARGIEPPTPVKFSRLTAAIGTWICRVLVRGKSVRFTRHGRR